MSYNRWVVKQIVVHPYNEILLSNIEGQIIIATTWMDLRGIMLNVKKPILQGHILYISIYSLRDGEGITDCQGLEVVVGWSTCECEYKLVVWGDIWGDEIVLYFDSGGGYVYLCMW